MPTRTRPPIINAETEQAEADRVTASLAGLAAALFFVVVSLSVVHHLRDEGRVEDCLMSGRSNCDILVAQR